MVDVTDQYCRYFMRLLTKHAWLYTEMINENAVLQSTPETKLRLIDYTPN